MTFIANVLTKDFSMLIADRKASIEGTNEEPAIIKVGNITIKAAKGINLIGFQKIYVNSDENMALGISGDANEHTYIKDFKNTNMTNDAIDLVEGFISKNIKFKNREELVGLSSVPQQEGVLTFYDNILNEYFSCMYSCSVVSKCIQLFKAPDKGVRIHMRGTGATRFSEIVQNEELEILGREITGESSIDTCVNWFIPIYEKMSHLDSGVSKSIAVWVSRRSNPKFENIHNTTEE